MQVATVGVAIAGFHRQVLQPVFGEDLELPYREEHRALPLALRHFIFNFS